MIVQEKLESLRRCVARIELRCSDSARVLMSDPDAQDFAVHNYGEMNWEIVHAISHHGLVDFRQFAREVGELLE